MAIVRFKKNKYPQKDIDQYYHTLLNKQFIFFGEIPNQPGHCVLKTVGPRDQDYVGAWELFRHTDDFEEVPQDEL